MRYTVIKSNNKAWLKKDASLPCPKFSALEMLSPAVDTDTPIKEYENHLASLRTIQIAPEYVDYWEKGAKLDKGQFEIIKQIVEVIEKIRPNGTKYKDAEYIKVAIPVQKDDEAVLWDEMEQRLKEIIASSKEAMPYKKTSYDEKEYLNEWKISPPLAAKNCIAELKYKYEIKRKQ